MKTWQTYSLMNLAALAGIAISLFIVPGETPFWIWAACSALGLALCNLLIYFRAVRRRNATSASAKREWVVALFGLAFLIIDLVLSRFLN
jgi:uncharacterized YccA/Bax inhibitor family protein